MRLLRPCHLAAATNLIEHDSLSGGRSTQAENSENHQIDQRPLKRERLNTSDGDNSNISGSDLLAELYMGPVWRGSFTMDGESFETGRLEGYLSSKACIEVCELACKLPSKLRLEKLRLLYPESLPSFMPLPTDENMHIRFFPEKGRDDEDIDNLINVMVIQSLAMKATADDVELFLYSSHKLQDKYQRIHGKYYVWAMLRGKVESHASLEAKVEQRRRILRSKLKRDTASLFSCKHHGSRDEPNLTDTLMNDEEADEADPQTPLNPSGAENCITNLDCFAEVERRIPNDITPAELKTVSVEIDNMLKTPMHSPDAPVFTPYGSEEGECGRSPDQTSSDSLSASLLHVVSALKESPSLDEFCAPNASEECVGRYFVKPSLAPILLRIIEKHGDFAEYCPLFSRSALTSILEQICMVVHDLQDVPFTTIQHRHLESMYHAILDGEVVKMDMNWLRRRYEELWRRIDHVRNYKEVMQTRAEISQAIETKKRCLDLKKADLEKLQCEIPTLENQLGLLTETTRKLESSAHRIMHVCKKFQHESLMDGLL